MGQNRTDFSRRIGRAARVSRGQRTFAIPVRSTQMVRNERITKMLARQEAFAKGLPVSEDATMDKPAIWTPFLSVILAIAMGAMAAMLARYVRFQLTGSIGPGAGALISVDLDLAIDIILSISIAFLMRELVSMSAIRQMGAQFAGILIAIVTMHNVVHQMPEPLTRLFSVEWVDHVTTTTEPGTLNFRGHSYRI